MRPTLSQYREEIASRRQLVIGTGAVALVAVVLVGVLGIAARQARPDITQTPFIGAGDRYFYAAIFVASALAGIAWHLADPDRAIHHRVTFSEVIAGERTELGATGWIGASIAVFSGGFILASLHQWSWIGIVMVTVMLTICVFGLARYAVLNQIPIAGFEPRLALLAVSTGLALLSFSAEYLYKAPTRYSVPVITALTLLILLQLTAGVPANGTLFSVVLATGGLLLAEVDWGMSFWNVSWFWGGVVLALAFFGMSSLMILRLEERVTALAIYVRLAIVVPVFLSVILLT